MLSREEIFFPYENIREIQGDMILAVKSVLENKTNLIAHAPTGLGKTIGALAPALKFAIDHGLTIFFLTSKHTQHQIVINTLKQIKKRYGIEIRVSDIIGKKWMCLQENVNELYSIDFHDYCKGLVEDNRCEFYYNARLSTGAPTVKAKSILNSFRTLSPLHTEDVIDICKKEKTCPYEISTLMAKEADVIIADYYYIFHPAIRSYFLQKSGKELEKAILIVDEGHNLPKRCQQLMTQRLSNFIVDKGISEAEKFKYLEALDYLKHINHILYDYSNLLKKEPEMLISREEFISRINENYTYENVIAELAHLGDSVRESQKISYLSSVSRFLEGWLAPGESYTRILSSSEFNGRHHISLLNKCLDASIVSKDVIDKAYSTILMSGTLTPTSMYKDILGFSHAMERNYKSPFPKSNRLNLIIPDTTTKYASRDNAQYSKIAEILLRICGIVPGNVAIFFPSYKLRDDISAYLVRDIKKSIVMEVQGLNKKEKTELIERFKNNSRAGSVLLGISSASFGEGVDIPGEFLKCVIVVGLPLEKPNLEIKELIRYYDGKFGRGWDYGYIFPAVNRCLQNAGRCIRSETDKGVIVFLDERYTYNSYKRCFPPEWDIKITMEYVEEIKRFFA